MKKQHENRQQGRRHTKTYCKEHTHTHMNTHMEEEDTKAKCHEEYSRKHIAMKKTYENTAHGNSNTKT